MCKLQAALQELLRARLLRPVEDLGRRSLLDDAALVHEHDAIADVPGEVHLVRDDEHRHPGSRKVAHDDEHLADELRVERRRDLVEEHHVRVHHQRPRDGDPLLLAARELVRMLVRLLLETDRGQKFVSPSLGVPSRHLPDPPRGERQIVDRRQLRKEIELLEDDPDALAYGGDVRALRSYLLAVEEDAAGLDGLEQVDAAKERALPAAARADDHEHLAERHGQVDPVEDEVVAEALAHAFEPHHRRPVRCGKIVCPVAAAASMFTRVLPTRCHENESAGAASSGVDGATSDPYPGSVVEREEGAFMKVICRIPFRLDVVLS